MPDPNDNSVSWSARYTNKIIGQLSEVSDAIFEKVENSISLLEQNIDLGTLYDPVYPAQKPSMACWRKHVPDTTKELFYIKDEGSHELILLFLADTRMNPLEKFNDFE